MFTIATLLLMQAAPAPAAVALSDSGDPPGRVARIALLEGSVALQPSGETGASSWSDASINYALTSGDRLYAERGGRAELQVGNCTLRINGVADLTIATLTDDFLQVSLATGTLRVSVYELSDSDSVEVDTPNGAVLLRRAGTYRIDVSESDDATTAAVDNGLADVAAGETTQSLHGGDALRLEGSDPIRVTTIPFPRSDDFDRWSAARDQPLGASASAQYVGRDVPGYDELDRAGQWETDADYGPVWYPTTVVVGWAPYRFGRWVWIDPWGWTWVDDAPWGWAPFHYGRWGYLHSRWGWFPGPRRRHPCYAPALVVFVSVGRVGVQGWFPLGPREPYHPWYHHGDRYRDRINPDIVEARPRDVRYVNRPQVTAVPAWTFQRGEAVGRRVVRVTNAEVDRAEIIAHPRFSPVRRGVTGTRAAPQAPATPRPVIQVTPWRRPASAAPVAKPAAPPTRRVPPHVIARNPPAPQALPFPTRQKGMQTDPGRPLEPEQRDNLREGKPAGPHRDAEDPPDRRPAQAAPKPKSAPPPQAAPPKRPQQRPSGRPS
ncbi:MAG TPA: DUF6600 domain-containing protein [Gemmatimonadales bacterium]|nr:DUF6600 domain-containing protein [Gemmatimonadales bacterium]